MVFDLETTGISRTFDEVVEISAVKVRSGQVVDEFSTLVNPGRHIPAAVSYTHLDFSYSLHLSFMPVL